jgi:hypothetical protein
MEPSRIAGWWWPWATGLPMLGEQSVLTRGHDVLILNVWGREELTGRCGLSMVSIFLLPPSIADSQSGLGCRIMGRVVMPPDGYLDATAWIPRICHQWIDGETMVQSNDRKVPVLFGGAVGNL